MHVVEREHERLGAGEPRQQFQHRAVRAVALDRQRRRGRSAEVGEGGEDAREQLRVQPAQPRVVECAQVRIERVDERAVGEFALVLSGAAGEHEHPARARVVLERPQQPRLADPGLPGDRHDARQLVERAPQDGQFAFAPDHRRDPLRPGLSASSTAASAGRAAAPRRSSAAM